MPCFQVPIRANYSAFSYPDLGKLLHSPVVKGDPFQNLHIRPKALCRPPLLSLSDSPTGAAVGRLESVMHALENTYCVLELSSCHLLGMVSLPNFSV